MTSKQIQDGGRTPYWKSFFAISRRHIDRSTWNLEDRWRITCNFRKFKMADGRDFENSIISISQPIIIRFWSYLVDRYTFQFPWWWFNKKFEILQIQDGGRTPFWKSFFGYISAPYRPIDAIFGKEMKNHMPIQVTWPKLQFSKI